MKSKHQILTFILLIFFTVSGIAGAPTLTFFSANGTLFEIPVKAEEAIDSIPNEILSAYVEEQKAERIHLVEKQFDIRSLSRPEPDANDVEIDTRSIFLDTLFSSCCVQR